MNFSGFLIIVNIFLQKETSTSIQTPSDKQSNPCSHYIFFHNYIHEWILTKSKKR